MLGTKIKYTKDSLKFLAKQNKKTVERIRNGIMKLTLNPPEGDIKLLEGYSDGRKRLRVGDWRVVFRYDKGGGVEILYIIDIGNRGDIYK